VAMAARRLCEPKEGSRNLLSSSGEPVLIVDGILELGFWESRAASVTGSGVPAGDAVVLVVGSFLRAGVDEN